MKKRGPKATLVFVVGKSLSLIALFCLLLQPIVVSYQTFRKQSRPPNSITTEGMSMPVREQSRFPKRTSIIDADDNFCLSAFDLAINSVALARRVALKQKQIK